MSDLHEALVLANKAMNERDQWKERFEELAKKQIEERKEWVAVGEEGGRQLEREEIMADLESYLYEATSRDERYATMLNEVLKRIKARVKNV